MRNLRGLGVPFAFFSSSRLFSSIYIYIFRAYLSVPNNLWMCQIRLRLCSISVLASKRLAKQSIVSPDCRRGQDRFVPSKIPLQEIQRASPAVYFFFSRGSTSKSAKSTQSKLRLYRSGFPLSYDTVQSDSLVPFASTVKLTQRQTLESGFSH